MDCIASTWRPVPRFSVLELSSRLLKTKIDVEGLAIAPGGTLYGIDDDTLDAVPH